MHKFINEEIFKTKEGELNKILADMDYKELPTANIMVAGITGVGKSTLLNSVFNSDIAETGKGNPVTQQIKEYNNPNLPICIWDTVGLELDSEKTKESINAIRQTVANKAKSEDPFDRIHAIWYCINSGSSRYQGAELDFIKNLHSMGVPFIIVLTQCIAEENEVNAFESKIRKMNESMGMSDIDIIQVCAKDFKMRGFEVPAFGLEVLVDKTVEKIPDFIRDGFIAAQRVSKAQKRSQCEEIIYLHVKAAKEGFWDKIPLVNILSADNRIKNMLRKVGEFYNAYIPPKYIEKIAKESNIDFINAFDGLINPFYGNYHKKVMALLNSKKEEGFEVNFDDSTKSDRVAILIAYYGYSIVSTIEDMWEKLTEEQLRDIDTFCKKFIEIINEKLAQMKK